MCFMKCLKNLSSSASRHPHLYVCQPSGTGTKVMRCQGFNARSVRYVFNLCFSYAQYTVYVCKVYRIYTSPGRIMDVGSLTFYKIFGKGLDDLSRDCHELRVRSLAWHFRNLIKRLTDFWAS